MTLKKIIKRVFEEIRATVHISKITSLKDGLSTFFGKIIIQKLSRNGFKQNESQRKLLDRKHDIMRRYFDKVLKNYNFETQYSGFNNQDNMCNKVWVCWWQGLDNAPEIVKKCVESIKANVNSDHEVVLITNENFRKYVDIPQWVIDKRDKGIISNTHFSDILRIFLLAQHGGIWLDSTFFCINADINNYFKNPLWTIKRPKYLNCSVANGFFANYSLGCSYEKKWIFCVILNLLLYYWENNDFMVDYLFLDYLIDCVIRNNIRVKTEFDNIKPNNKNCDELFKILNSEFDETIWNVLKKDTCLFKLSWKYSYSLKSNTFYDVVIRKE